MTELPKLSSVDTRESIVLPRAHFESRFLTTTVGHCMCGCQCHSDDDLAALSPINLPSYSRIQYSAIDFIHSRAHDS